MTRVPRPPIPAVVAWLVLTIMGCFFLAALVGANPSFGRAALLVAGIIAVSLGGIIIGIAIAIGVIRKAVHDEEDGWVMFYGFCAHRTLPDEP